MADMPAFPLHSVFLAELSERAPLLLASFSCLLCMAFDAALSV